jgi:hypothetical protein
VRSKACGAQVGMQRVVRDTFAGRWSPGLSPAPVILTLPEPRPIRTLSRTRTERLHQRFHTVPMPTLATLTDPAAVKAAMAEFDQIGRDAFLDKHRFGQARSYFLVREGRLYDSKAIFAVAFGIQHPQEGPLPAHSFSGGEQTVAHRLRALGFDVRKLDSDRAQRSYWAMLADPRIYDIEQAVQTLELDLWTTAKSPVRAGDRVAIWRASGKDGRRGVVAFGDVLTDPVEQLDAENPLWLSPDGGLTLKPRALVRYVPAPKLPLWVGSEGAEVLEDLSVFRARGGTVFRITDDQWTALVTAAGGWDGPSPEGAALIAAATPRRARAAGGQGFGLSAEERRVVENRATELAFEYYRKDWPEVEDRSAKASYDFYCRSPDSHLYVEVKGTTGQGGTVLLTSNEVALSARQHPNTALFLVSEIRIAGDSQGNVVARGGKPREVRPWRASDMTLRATTYECTLQRDD